MMMKLKATLAYLTSRGEDRIKRDQELEVKTILCARAIMAEVCIESSFQVLKRLLLIEKFTNINGRVIEAVAYICSKILSTEITFFR
jgi:hypothetical protein